MKIICIGFNYIDHIKELNSELPAEPMFFMKPETALLQKHNPFFIPEFSKSVHYEVEMTIRICKTGKYIQEEFAPNYYDAVGVGIDFTARDLQLKCRETGAPWEICKAFDHSAPLSEFIPIGEIKDIENVSIRLDINGKTVQQGNTSNMIFNVNKIIEHVSKYVTLKIGDVIMTGTPPGVGEVRIGDRLEAYIEDRNMLTLNVR